MLSFRDNIFLMYDITVRTYTVSYMYASRGENLTDTLRCRGDSLPAHSVLIASEITFLADFA